MQRLSWRALVGRSRVRGMRYRDGRRWAGLPVSSRALRLAAEVLEPRCLLTDSAGVEFTRSGSTVVVSASQWGDDGLTLFVRNDSFEIGHTDESAMTVIPFESVSRLVLQGGTRRRTNYPSNFMRLPLIAFPPSRSTEAPVYSPIGCGSRTGRSRVRSNQNRIDRD